MMDKTVKKIGFIFLASGIFVFVLCFLLYFTESGRNAGALEQVSQTERSNIFAVIKGGVEDDSWWEAKSVTDVKSVLSKYYTGELLEELCGKVWNFVSMPTDWYWQTRVVEIKIVIKTKDMALLDADLEILDVTTNQKEKGGAQYIIKKTGEGWRIVNSSYSWPE